MLWQLGLMKLTNDERPAVNGSSVNQCFSDPFVFLPMMVEALKGSDVSCRFCSVRMVSKVGINGGLCPVCFEERCAKCGEGVLPANGKLAPGLTVGRGGSWKCAKCSASWPKGRLKRLSR